MKKLSIAILALISAIILLYVSILLLLDHNSIYQNFLKNLNVDISTNSISKIQVHKFPVPYLKIEKLEEEGKAQINNLEVKFSLLSLLTFSPKIKHLSARGMVIYLNDANDMEFSLTSHHKVITSIIKKGFGNIEIDIANLTFINQEGHNLLVVKDFKFLNAKEFKGKYNDIDFSGNLNHKEKEGNFEISILSDGLQLNELYENYELSRGAAKIQIKDFQYFLNYFIPNVNNIFSNITSKEVIDITLDIFNTKDALSFKNVKIQSPSNATQGEGEVTLFSSDEVINQIKFNFINLNLITDENAQSIETTSLGYKDSGKFTFENKLVDINIGVDELLFNKQKLGGIKLNAKFNKNILRIEDFSGKIEDDGNFTIEGFITNNDYRNIFDGKVNLSHNDFNDMLTLFGYDEKVKTERKLPFTLTTLLKFSSIDLYLRDILFQIPDAQVTGKVAIKFIGSMPRISSILEISALDLDKTEYPVITPVIKYLGGLFDNMKDNSYLNKYIPIRTISYLGNLDLTFQNFTIFGEEYNKVHLLTGISPSKITIDNLYIVTKNNDYISAKLKLEAQEIKPEISITINDAFMPINFLMPKTLEALRNKVLENYDLEKIKFKMDGTASTLYQNDLELKNVAFNMQNDGNLIKIANLRTEIFSGKLSIQGSILLSPYTFNFVYALNSASLEHLSQFVPKSLMTNNQGNFSANGMISTNGESIEKLLFNLYTKSRFVSKGIKISNFSIDDLVSQINDPTYNAANLTGDVRKSMLTGETTFNELEGEVELNRGYLILKDMKFKTKFTAGVFASTLNIYDFKLNLSSIFSFFYKKPGVMQRASVNFPIKAEGSFFQPNKIPDTAELEMQLKPSASNAGGIP